jgi:hypothetical protein
MRPDVAGDLTESADLFLRLVWPAVAPMVRGGQMVPVESVADAGMTKDLDTLAGIDAWQMLRSDCCMRGIASRVQPDKDWSTFTIRYSRATGAETEFKKRLRAIRDGMLYPALTIQGYVGREKASLLSAAVIRTADLFRFVEEHIEESAWQKPPRMRTVGVDRNKFVAVPWAELQSAGINVGIVRPDTNAPMPERVCLPTQPERGQGILFDLKAA